MQRLLIHAVSRASLIRIRENNVRIRILQSSGKNGKKKLDSYSRHVRGDIKFCRAFYSISVLPLVDVNAYIYPISCRQHLAPSNPRSRLTRSSCRSSVKHWRRSSKARSQSHQRPSAAAAALQRRDNSQRRQLG